MARSMALVGAVVALLFLVVWWQRPEGGAGSAVTPVDVPGVVAAVRIGNGLPVWEPTGLSAQWRPTAAWFAPEDHSGVASSGSLLLVGYLTPLGSYAEVRQSDAAPVSVLPSWTDDGRFVGTVSAGGHTWRHLRSPTTGKEALATTRRVSGRRMLVVVTGKASLAELTTLAGSLR
jgi:hypothetical protein